MWNGPKGYWKCPKCNGYVKDNLSVCPVCKSNKNGSPAHPEQSVSASSEVKSTDATAQVDSTASNSEPEEAGGLLARIFAGFALFLWLGGFIASIALSSSSTPEYNRYGSYVGTKTEFHFAWFLGWLTAYFFSGALCMAISKALRYLDTIARNTTEIKNAMSKK